MNPLFFGVNGWAIIPTRSMNPLRKKYEFIPLFDKSMKQHVEMYDSIPFSMNRLRRKYEFIPLFDKSMNQHVKMYDSIPFSMNRLRQKYEFIHFLTKV